MYRQNNQSFDSVGRRSSYNPFRQGGLSPNVTAQTNLSGRSISPQKSSSSAFDDWVNRNRKLINESSDDDEPLVFERPAFPTQTRTGSDTNVNYGRKMSSNNPFAAAMEGEYKHHRDPPPPPQSFAKAPVSRMQSPEKHSRVPTREPTRESSSKKSALPPPSYEEAAGPKASAKPYPKEKDSHRSSSSRPTRPHRSHSDSAKPKDAKDSREHKDRKSRHKSSKDAKKKAVPHQSKNLDVIDKLDVSAFFGGRFHHDGPFDACAPHRNKNVKAAPVMAFPVDGPNTSMKASATANDNIDLAFGHFGDHNMIVGSSAASQPKALGREVDVPRLNPSVVAFDAHEKAAPIHGLPTAGLGSTTFLNGAPAPKNTSADEYLAPPNAIKGGLGRKKSLRQRLRGNSGSDNPSRRSSNENSGEYARASFGDEETSSSLLSRVKSLKVGRK